MQIAYDLEFKKVFQFCSQQLIYYITLEELQDNFTFSYMWVPLNTFYDFQLQKKQTIYIYAWRIHLTVIHVLCNGENVNK